jgi:membrane-associated phospholipid phosphatase
MKWLHQFDQTTAEQIQKLPSSWLPLMKSLSWLGEPIIVLAIGAVSFALSVKQSLDAEARAFIMAAIAFWLGILLKFGLRRRRPNDIDIKTFGLQSYSFPSGHAFGPVIFYGLIAYLDFNYLSSPLNIVITLGIVFLIFLIGISRVYLRIHYPSDVIVGWILGLIFLVVIITSLP